jgi:hypothetical protein
MTGAWDEAAWARLADELARWADSGRPATFWWRDDDAGASHPALTRLLALAGALDLPLVVAVVPAWLTADVAAQLRGAPAGVVVWQHGLAHQNHEPARDAAGRKVKGAELGPARPAAAALADLAAGWPRLAAAVGPRLAPGLVPPWNRIAPAVLAGLPALGYRVLSTFGPRAAALAAPGLRQVNCHADPIVWREGRRFAGAAVVLERLCGHLADRREGRADPDEPTGLLTHHQAMDEPGWAFLAEALARLRGRAAWVRSGSRLGDQPPPSLDPPPAPRST